MNLKSLLVKNRSYKDLAKVLEKLVKNEKLRKEMNFFVQNCI